jgi:hypothetical protein
VFLGQYNTFNFSIPRERLSTVSELVGSDQHTFGRSTVRKDNIRKGQKLLDEIFETDSELTAVTILQLLAIAEGNLLTLQFFEKKEGLFYEIKSCYEPAFAELTTWFSSPWWNRIWVVQETVLPTKLSVICGSYLVPWHVLVNAADSLYNYDLILRGSVLSLPSKYESTFRNIYTKVLELETLRGIRSHGRDMGVLELLWTYRHRQATDPRDHVFALYGLLPGHFAVARIIPDYSIDTRETFIGVTLNMIATTGSLDILVGAGMRYHELDLPSWVQDWTYAGEVESHFGPYRYLATMQRQSAGSENYMFSSPMNHAIPFVLGNYSREGSVLSILSTLVGTIQKVGSMVERQAGPDSFKTIYQEWLMMAGLASLGTSPKQVNFWRSLNYGLLMNTNGKILGLRAPQVFLAPAASEWKGICETKFGEGVALPDPGHPDFAAVELLTHKRRFFITQDGKFGIGPGSIQIGDEIHIFPRGRVPFVLRPSPQQDTRSCPQLTTPCYALVGDCYLDGVMQGEAVNVEQYIWRSIHLH